MNYFRFEFDQYDMKPGIPYSFQEGGGHVYFLGNNQEGKMIFSIGLDSGVDQLEGYAYPVQKELPRFMKDGRVVQIGRGDAGFFEMLQNQPAELKIRMMNLTDAEMLQAIKSRAQNKEAEVLDLFKKNWIFCETGEPYNFDDIEINQDLIGISEKKDQIIKLIKKHKLQGDQLDRILNEFSNCREIRPLNED